MRKLFYSLAIALCALMVSIPAKAGNVFDAFTLNDLFGLLCQGMTTTHDYVGPEDTIRLQADITYSTSVTSYFSLYIPANATRTLDLNGKTLQSTQALTSAQDANTIEMQNNSTLNICDTKGGGKLINNTLLHLVGNDIENFSDHTFHRGTYYINSACIVNRKGSQDYPVAANCTVNIYGGSIIAKSSSQMDDQCSAIFCRPNVVTAEGQPSLMYANGGYLSNPNMTVNIYGGYVSAIRSYKYTFKTYEEDYQTVQEARSYWQEPDLHLHFSYKDYYSNPLNINLYGGNIGQNGMSIPALTYPKGFSGTLKDGTIYGIASDDHLNNFNGVADGVKVYLNGTQTTVNALKTQDLADKTVRFAYEPEISVSGVEVTKDNCTDIIPWEEFKASFDYATNTLYLKTLSNPTNVLNGIQFSDFDLRIVVDGYWRINGSIVGTNGDLTITSNHFALTEEDGDALVMKPGDNTAITLPGHRLTLTNRVRLLCYNNESGHTPQSAVKCHDMWVNNSWFDAWGKKPIVDCTYGSVVNATIKTGSFKNNDVIQVEPNITKYVVWVEPNDYNAGSTNGDAYVAEGTSHTAIATPNSGYHFLRWSNGVTDNPYTFVVTQDTALYALFEADEVINYYDITVVSEDETMGTVSGGGTHLEQGQTVTITATPNEGYEFLYWTTANGQVQGAISQWTATQDETLIAHFRVQPPADAISLWVCGTQVTGSNSADILGDGVWCYDHATRTLTAMKNATYNISNDGFISDLIQTGPLTVVLNHLIDITCTTTDQVIRWAVFSAKGITFTGSAYKGLNLNVKNMYAGSIQDDLNIAGHIDFSVFLSNTTTFGQNNFDVAFFLSKKLVVNGATVDIGTSEATYKVSNKTNSNLQLTNAEIISGALDQRSLYIYDNSPKYEINYLTPSLESLCAVGGFNSYFEDTYVTLRAYPASGYRFVSWSDGNTDNPRYMVMPAQNVYLDPIVEVDDSQTPKGAIINASATEGQGTIADFTSGWYAEGTELTITAVPADGYEFVQWSDGEMANPYLLTVENGKNISITAVFREGPHEAIDEINHNSEIINHKYIKDGILYIERNGRIYDAQGQAL